MNAKEVEETREAVPKEVALGAAVERRAPLPSSRSIGCDVAGMMGGEGSRPQMIKETETIGTA